jgi:segregation and condensation protein B
MIWNLRQHFTGGVFPSACVTPQHGHHATCNSVHSIPMTIPELIPHVEALIFASDKPVGLAELNEFLNAALEIIVPADDLEAAVEAVSAKYDAEEFPFGLHESGGGFQFLTKPQFHKTVLQLNGEKHIRKLSSAAMETLAIVAYKQPVTKGEIEYIRGVSADYSIQKLLEKDLIAITGRREDAVGKPLEYATSKSFMDYLGIASPKALPQLRDIVSTDIVIPTEATEALPTDTPLLEQMPDGSVKIDEPSGRPAGDGSGV